MNPSPADSAVPALIFDEDPSAGQSLVSAWAPSLASLLRSAGLEPLVADVAGSAAESSIAARLEHIGNWLTARPSADPPRIIVSVLPMPNLELGAAMAARLDIPHVVMEPVALAADRQVAWPDTPALGPILRRAAAVVSFGHTLPEPLRELAETGKPIVRLRPAIDTEGLTVAWRQRDQIRVGLAGRLRLLADKPWLVTLADMTPGSALESYRLLARAVSRLMVLDWTLIVAGSGPARDQVAGLFASLPPGRFRYWDTDAPQQRLQLMVAGDLFVWPALDGIGASALLAAQTGGVPVTACDGADVRDRVEDGITGRIAAAGNAESLANGIGFLLRQRQFLQTYAEQARELALDRHALPCASAALERGLRGLLDVQRQTA